MRKTHFSKLNRARRHPNAGLSAPVGSSRPRLPRGQGRSAHTSGSPRAQGTSSRAFSRSELRHLDRGRSRRSHSLDRPHDSSTPGGCRRTNGGNRRRLRAHQPGDKGMGQRLKHAPDSTIGGFQTHGFRFLESPRASAPRHPAVVRMPPRAAVERPDVIAALAEGSERRRRRPPGPRCVEGGSSLAPLGPRDQPEHAEKEEPDHE